MWTPSSADMPLFSVVIPVFNRRELVERAIKSVRNQTQGQEVEIVVVDDASTDGSFEALQGMVSKYRLILKKQDKNRGIGPTRNSGIAAARGEWILPLDSDDELAPEALGWLTDLITSLPNDINRVRCMVSWDDGRLTPEPALKEEIWGYEDYVRAIDVPDGTGVESASAFRRPSLMAVPYPKDRTHELLFHLDYAAQFKMRTTGRVLRQYHSGTYNNTRSQFSRVRLLSDVADWANQVDDILVKHGPALEKLAPNIMRQILHSGVKYHFLCGNRRRALSFAVRGLRWPNARLAAYLVFGLLGRGTLAWVVSRLSGLVK